jgi:uncharacterized membrane protein YkvA (DUF1232 family)
MKNRFLTLALSQAKSLPGKNSRMLQLVARMAAILYQPRRQNIGGSLKDGLFAFGRLISSYAKGNYREISLKTLLKILAAIIYFVNPLDLIPDAIVGIGFLDDIAVLTWVHRSASVELDRFKCWEATRATPEVIASR